jgi:hypothetical protein
MNWSKQMKKLITLTVLSFIGINAFAYCPANLAHLCDPTYAHQQRMERMMQEQNDILEQQRLNQAFQNSRYDNSAYRPSCYINVAGVKQCF